MHQQQSGRHWAALLLVLAVGAAPAAVYRCERNGEMIYGDQPCAHGDAPVRLPPVGVVPGTSKTEADLARQHDERTAAERKTQGKADAAWLKDRAARKDEAARFAVAAREHRVLKGMSADHVRLARGSPDEVERFEGGEHWVYGSGKARETVIFEDGRVTGTRKSGKR